LCTNLKCSGIFTESLEKTRESLVIVVFVMQFLRVIGENFCIRQWASENVRVLVTNFFFVAVWLPCSKVSVVTTFIALSLTVSVAVISLHSSVDQLAG